MATGDRPTTSERDELADVDSPNDNTSVITAATGAANGGYVYYDSTKSGTPHCDAGDSDTEFVTITIVEAKRRNKSSYQMCERLRSQ